MATVPQIQRTERLNPLLQQNITTQANADDFGAGIGRGMQDVARGVAGFAEAAKQVRAKEDQVRAQQADDAFSAYKRDLDYNPDNGFFHKEGQDAVDAFPEYQKKLNEGKAKYGKSLTGDAAEAYGRVARNRVDQGEQSGMIHTGQAKKQWFKNASESRLNTFGQDAIAGYKNPKLVESNIANGLMELKSRADEEGWDEATLKDKSAAFASLTRRNVVMRMANDDPLGADAYYQKNKDKFVGTDQAAIEDALEEGVATAGAQADADRILKGPSGGEAAAPDAEGNVPAAPAKEVKAVSGTSALPNSFHAAIDKHEGGGNYDTLFGHAQKSGRFSGVRVSSMTVGQAIAFSSPGGAYANSVKGKIGRVATPMGKYQIVGATLRNAARELNIPMNAMFDQNTQDKIALHLARRRLQTAGSMGGKIAALRNEWEGLRNVPADQMVNIVRDIEGGKTGSVSASGSGSSGGGMNYGYVQGELEKIKDPKRRELAARYINNMVTMQEKQYEANKKAAEMEVFKVVEQGGSPDDLPIELRLLAGQSSMTSAWSYYENKLKRGEPETDQTLLYSMRRNAATNPQEFAQQNLLEYRDRLDNTAFKELTDLQTSVLGNSTKAIQTGSFYADAYKAADTQLAAAGISMDGLGGEKKAAEREAMAKRIALFQNGLKDQIDAYAKQADRLPTYAEVQKMVAQSLLPVVIKQQSEGMFGNMFGGGERKGFAFDAQSRAPGEVVDVAVEYANIPVVERATIEKVFMQREGRAPTPQEVEQEYEDFYIGNAPPRPTPLPFDPMALRRDLTGTAAIPPYSGPSATEDQVIDGDTPVFNWGY